jgi:CheY-like chemotaxis protein
VRILVAEDDKTSRLIIEAVLTPLGWVVLSGKVTTEFAKTPSSVLAGGRAAAHGDSRSLV